MWAANSLLTPHSVLRLVGVCSPSTSLTHRKTRPPQGPGSTGLETRAGGGETCVSKPQRRFLSSALLLLGLLLVTCVLTPGHWRSETPELRRVG